MSGYRSLEKIRLTYDTLGKNKKPRFDRKTFALEWLSSSIMGRGVQQLKFGIDTSSYSVMMNKFIASAGLDREFGFTRLEMTASKTSSDTIIIVSKKRTLYEVAIHDGYQLYEIGLKDDGLRHFKDASFTEFGESYPQMVGSLHGLRIDREVFRNSVMSIMNNPGDCKEWPHSAGILAFMIAKAGRFFPVDKVLRTMMCVDLSITLDNEYQWLAEYLINGGFFLSGTGNSTP
nr:hypothetical protein [Tanacetum cinerariifolium]